MGKKQAELTTGPGYADEVRVTLMQLMARLDAVVRNSTGYLPDRGMYWYTVDEAKKILTRINELRGHE